MFLLANITSLIQPMHQGIIYTAKRLYKKKLLNEILEAEEPAAGKEEIRKNYNVRSLIFNFVFFVKNMKPSTLINSWKKFLINEEVRPDTAGLEIEDFHSTFH